MADHGKKRGLSSVANDVEIIDDPEHHTPKRTRPGNINTLLRADKQLATKTQEVITDITQSNHSMLDAIRELHALGGKITEHEAMVKRYLEDNVHRRGNYELQPVDAHRKSWDRLKSRGAAIIQGIIEQLLEVTTKEGPASLKVEILQQEIESNKTTAATHAQSLKAVIEVMKNENESLNGALESLRKAVESLKKHPSKEVQLSADTIRQAIEKPTGLRINQAFEEVAKRIQPLEQLLQSTLHAQKSNQPSTQSNRIDRNLNSKKVSSSNFFDRLKDVDFRPSSGMWDWVSMNWQVLRYELWGDEKSRYLLQFNLQAPVCPERQWRGCRGNSSSRDQLESPLLVWYSQNVMELELREDPPFLLGNLPKYVVYLGDLLVHAKSSDDGHPSYETSENNMCLVMDVATPSKSLWLVYRYEYQPDRELREFGFHPDRKSFPSIKRGFDLVSIADSIGDWKEGTKEFPYRHLDYERVEYMMRHTACRVKPRFTKPGLDDVVRAISAGWAGYEDTRPE